jgi:hypothetical protein
MALNPGWAGLIGTALGGNGYSSAIFNAAIKAFCGSLTEPHLNICAGPTVCCSPPHCAHLRNVLSASGSDQRGECSCPPLQRSITT